MTQLVIREFETDRPVVMVPDSQLAKTAVEVGAAVVAGPVRPGAAAVWPVWPV